MRRPVPLILVPLILTLVLVAAPASGATGQPLRFTGDAVVRGIGANRVAIFLDSNGDRVIDHGFLLSSDIPIASNVAVSYPSARVEFTDGYARLTASNHLYDLYVAGYPEPPAAPSEAEALRFTGYALMHSSGESGCDLERALEGDAGVCYRYGEQ
jgi:hypothetical protein